MDNYYEYLFFINYNKSEEYKELDEMSKCLDKN